MEEILIIHGDIRDYKDCSVPVISPEENCFSLKGDVFTDLREIPF